MERTAFVHVDMDSPATLARFWGLAPGAPAETGAFYARAMERALELFRDCGVVATFFCVGEELETVPEAAEAVRGAAAAGHEIANHTWSHPFGLSSLGAERIAGEISRCSAAIEAVVGTRPRGFRAPSFDAGPEVIEALVAQGFAYDSSVFPSSLGGLIQAYHALFRRQPVASGYRAGFSRVPRAPYYQGALLEIPMPATRLLRFPFYNNFHLAAGEIYRKLAVRRMDQGCFPYLFHLIEFYGLEDGLRRDLAVHPNVRTPVRVKLARMRDTLLTLRRKYRIVRTDEFACAYGR